MYLKQSFWLAVVVATPRAGLHPNQSGETKSIFITIMVSKVEFIENNYCDPDFFPEYFL